METHEEIFSRMIGRLLVDGKMIGVDTSTMEVNAAMRAMVRRDSREADINSLIRLATESGIETPAQTDPAGLRRKRPNGSNKERKHPHDPDARITKMKDGRTHLAHHVGHAVDKTR